ncbi:hypothetical protein KIN20_012058 [Parelaphostrongylus tenuis]|uniref:Arachidonate--CoA ligase n=1 Tax=Parelaphostrongylus tenuis TaxID=148309 RepID=A0AAD5QK71_PARTN|nr:hypothetical protein KIN20_012058 [Parelaphostrongylus tenuis]
MSTNTTVASTIWTVFPLATTLIGTVFFFLFRKLTKQICSTPSPSKISRKAQSIPVKGEQGVYKCGLLLSDDENIIENIFADVNTLWDAFNRGMKESEDGPCLGTRGSDRHYRFIKYSDVLTESSHLSSALLGVFNLEPGSRVGIYAKNRAEWLISALACVSQSIIVVPLYDTLGSDAISFIVSQTEISVVIADTMEKARNLASIKGSMPTLKTVVLMDWHDDASTVTNEVSSTGIELLSLHEVCRQGSRNPQPRHLPNKDDTYIIWNNRHSKGVIITHANILSNISGMVWTIGQFIPDVISHKSVVISYLPLSHMMEQLSHWLMLIHGAQIGYFSGNIQLILDDLNALRPTIFPTVPRLLNKFHDSIQQKVQNQSFFSRAVFNLAYSMKLALLKKGVATTDSIWDKLVFRKIQAQFGGRVHLMITGSAPVSGEVLEACRVAFGATIMEGYGQTECSGAATMTWPGEWTVEHCGGVEACCNIKLADIPELNYFSKDGKGEIMIRGPGVTKGYYKDPEKTADLFDEHGFLHTGDVGELLPNGTIRIIDRKKHIFKLAQGEYVAPEKIENVYLRSPVVEQVFVDGNSLERWLIAIVIPDRKTLEDWNAKHGAEGRSIQQICADKKAQEYVLSKLSQIGAANKLNFIEQVKRVYLETDPFTIENGLLTPTLKAKRPQLRQKYKEIMEQIYTEDKKL